ncbi:MAG: hypothetical protein MZV64_22755 [Ignavibacteriales bacterium]|nr:hypothetical protein [Ignavibacteriales bacterium]
MENIKRDERGLRPLRHPVLPRRLPLRRERLVHQDAREGLRQEERPSRSPRRCSPTPTGRP